MEKLQSSNTFFISRKVFQEIINHCKFDLPYEACGLVSGQNGVAKKIWKMKNHALSTISFSMDIEEIQSVFELIDNRKDTLLGIYHSHPTDWAYPSAEDIALNNYPDVGHLIISFTSREPVIKCFRMNGNLVEQLIINLID